jgi:hypothetical protein
MPITTSNNKYASKLIFFNEKNLRKIPMILTLKIDFESRILALFDTSPLHQFSKFNKGGPNLVRIHLVRSPV